PVGASHPARPAGNAPVRPPRGVAAGTDMASRPPRAPPGPGAVPERAAAVPPVGVDPDLCGRPRRPVRRGPGDALELPGETTVPRHADQRAPRTHPPGEHHLSPDPGGGDGGDRLDPRAVPAGPRR